MKVSVKIEGLKELDEQLGKIDKEFRGKSLYESLNFASQPMLNAARRGARVAEKRYRRYMSHGQGEATYVKTKNGKWRAGKSKRAKPGEGKFEWQEPGLLKKSVRRRRLNKKSKNEHRASVGIYMHKGTGKTHGSAYYWRFIEYGTKKMPATPFIRPAYHNHEAEAVDRFKSRLAKSIKKHGG